MKTFSSAIAMCVLLAGTASAQQSKEEMIASAQSAGPDALASAATIKTMEGEVLREGTNGWTCYVGNEQVGAMCNDSQWDAVLMGFMHQQPVEVKQLSVSYMLAGDPKGGGVSNIDPFATAPTADNQWVTEGPHLMIVIPNAAALEGLSTNPEDPVYVMWKGTPYAHIMVKVEGK